MKFILGLEFGGKLVLVDILSYSTVISSNVYDKYSFLTIIDS